MVDIEDKYRAIGIITGRIEQYAYMLSSLICTGIMFLVILYIGGVWFALPAGAAIVFMALSVNTGKKIDKLHTACWLNDAMDTMADA